MKGLLIFSACLILVCFIETNDNKHLCFFIMLIGFFGLSTDGFNSK